MKKLLPVILLSATATLAGCATPGTGGGPAPTPSDVVAQIQQVANATCHFAPIGQVIAQIIASAVPAGAVAIPITDIGRAICDAYLQAQGAPPLARRAARRANLVVTPGAVNGIPIR